MTPEAAPTRGRSRLGSWAFVALLLAALAPGRLRGAAWVRAGLATNQPLWGLRGGVQFALHPAGFRGHAGGPRGLIRLGHPVLTNGSYDLINFIAVEPIVHGRRGFSELEPSALDARPGKCFWAGPVPGKATPADVLDPGRLEALPGQVERLCVPVTVERFANGAHLRLLIAQRSDRPDEIDLSVQAEPDSAPMDRCILTATMGNMARTRLLWLKDEVLRSTRLYAAYTDTGFAPQTRVARQRLHSTPAGETLVAVTTDEPRPADVFPFPGTRHWYYGGDPLTQYWKVLPRFAQADLHVVVNGRYAYWQSRQPIPGGVAFENFELEQSFVDGQTVAFGLTRRTPAELGFRATVAP